MNKTANVVASLLFVSMLLMWLAAPRGPLDGKLLPPPDDWSFVGDQSPCRLETRARKPRSIRVDCYAVDGELYVNSHRFTETWRPFGYSWPVLLRANSVAHIQLDDALYMLSASEVHGPERTAILAARGYDPPPDAMALFRFAGIPSPAMGAPAEAR